ncbi:MAG: GHMP kinase [Clostridia bacterium]|nr:GHMP kinase [Clostridia bacterium]
MINEFKKLFSSSENVKTTFCPYRVCPLGAHIDHQYGVVTGFALDKGIRIMFCETNDGTVEAASKNFPEKISFNVKDIPEFQGDWADYIRGAAYSLGKKYKLTKGVKALIEGTLPVGGLSSSAALILSFMSALCDANGVELTNKEKIYIAQAAENEYVGVNCGKLDQSCEVLCKKDHLLFLDNKTDEYELIPQNPNMPPYEIAIIFSGVERTLVGSAFNMRVDELKSASYALKAFVGMEYGKFKDSRLRDVPVEVFEEYKDKLPLNWAKRATHYYTEFERVKKGVEAWKNGDLVAFGKLMTESGNSSIYNYETGSDELKTIHEIMLETDGIYGGRFSGAGFKGCCVALINPEYKVSIKEKITTEYLKNFPQYKDTFSIHFCKSADGCK